MDKVTEDQILKEAHNEFEQNRIDAGDTSPKAEPAPKLAIAPKLHAKLSPVAVGLLVRVKNRVAIKILSRDLDQAGREIVAGVYETKAEEIEAYRQALEQTLNEHATPEFIEWVNRYAGSAFVAAVEIEVERFFMLRSMLAAHRVKPVVEASSEKLAA